MKVYFDELTEEETKTIGRIINKDSSRKYFFDPRHDPESSYNYNYEGYEAIRSDQADELVGIMYNSTNGYRTAQLAIYVLPKHRKQGVAKAAFEAVEKNLKDAGFEKIRNIVYSENRNSIKLHESVGYSFESENADYIMINGCLNDRLYFVKMLSERRK